MDKHKETDAKEDHKTRHVESNIFIQGDNVKEKRDEFDTEDITPDTEKDTEEPVNRFEQMMKQLEDLTLKEDRSEEFMKNYADQLQRFNKLVNILKFHLSQDWSELSGPNEKIAKQFITSFSPNLFKIAENIQQIFDEWITTNYPPPTEVVMKQSEWCVEYLEKMDNIRSVCREIAGARFCSTYLHPHGQSLYKTYETSSQVDLSESHEEEASYLHKKFGDTSKHEVRVDESDASKDKEEVKFIKMKSKYNKPPVSGETKAENKLDVLQTQVEHHNSSASR